MSQRSDGMTREIDRRTADAARASNHPLSQMVRAATAFNDARSVASGRPHRVLTDHVAPKILKSVGTNLRRRVSRSR